MYQIYPRSFTPEGTLAAATAKLPAVRELGVDVIYLAPVCLQDDDMDRAFWSPRQQLFGEARNPYRIKDYYNIDPEYGTDADLHAFVAEVHRLGMRVLMDIVFLHCGPKAVFIAEHPDFVERHPDGSIRLASWNFPKINFANGELREYLWRNLEYWLCEFHVDGFRCDVSDAIPLDFWQTARQRLEALKPDLIMLAEGGAPANTLAAFDLDYNFPWQGALFAMFYQGKPASALRAVWEMQAISHPIGARCIRYFDNHDLAHDCTTGRPNHEVPPDSRPDKAWGHAAVDAMLALCFTLDGMPFLYNGQEVADVAPHCIYKRMSVDWRSGDTPAGQARRAFVRKLCALRHAEAALADGDQVWLDTDAPDALLAFTRTLGAERILVIVNAKPTVAAAALPDAARYTPLLASGADVAGGTATLAPYGFFIGKTVTL